MRILNLGAGVQSTTLALMAEVGEIEKYDYAIFADMQAEPKSVYNHLDWLIKQLSYPVLVRTRGSLIENLKNGIENDSGRVVSIPAYTGQHGQKCGIVRRQCTSEYKIKVVEKTIRREIFGLNPGQRFPTDVRLRQSFGLSYDEQNRIFKVQRNHAASPWGCEFPLYELEMNRQDCIKWLDDYGVPHQVPRSACTFCPYHSDAEWHRIKKEDPESFQQAVEVDRLLRSPGSRCNQAMEQELWLHRSCKPLESVDFQAKTRGQSFLEFSMECEGMCGV